jgi:hypothetical protein
LSFDVSGLALLKQISPQIIVRQSQWDADLQGNQIILNIKKLLI